MIIVGAGGHAREVFDVLSYEDQKNVFFFDNINLYLPEELFGRPILRTIEDVNSFLQSDNRFVLGIGNPKYREQLFNLFLNLHAVPFTPIATSAFVSNFDVYIGEGANVMHKTFVSNSVRIGKGALINTGAHLHHDIEMGDFCEIAPAALLLGKAKMGKHVFVGAGAIILPGITVGDNVVIGAGAIVTKNISDNQKVKGNPAK
jgi:sugar O-acyltransferase (sialic acid O-acetyltransferase NeuD family)